MKSIARFLITVFLFVFATEVLAAENNQAKGAPAPEAKQVSKKPQKAVVKPKQGKKKKSHTKKVVKKVAKKIAPVVTTAPAVKPEAVGQSPAADQPGPTQAEMFAQSVPVPLEESVVVTPPAVPAPPQVVPKEPEKVKPAVVTPSIKKPEMRFEVGIFNNAAVSVDATPISDMAVKCHNSKSVRFIGPIPGQDNVEFTAGFSSQKCSIILAGVNLGDANSTSVSGTLRYRKVLSDHVTIYGGPGLHLTEYGEAPLLNGRLKMRPSGASGLVVEVGTSVSFKHGFYGDLNARMNLGSAGYNRLETSSGGALLTNVKIGNSKGFSAGLGYLF